MSVASLHVQERTFSTLPWIIGRMSMWMAAFSACGLLVVPKGLSLFAVTLVIATLLALPQAFARQRPPLPGAIRWLAVLAAALVLTAGVSAVWSGAGWNALDNPSRLLLLPWCAWLMWMYRLSASALGWGAVAGLLVACAISMVEASQGVGRAGGGINPIVFANAVLALLVLAVFCRPAMPKIAVRCLLVAVVAIAAVTITFSGSRGALPGLALVLVATMAGGHVGRWKRIAVASVVLLVASLLVWNVSWLSSKFRLDDVQMEVERYALGDVDTPVGARLALWGVAWKAVSESPMSGVGIEGFEARIDASPYCQQGPRHFCDLNHAHNDLAQWASTMGIPGLGALLALYLVPFLLATRLLRKASASSGDGVAARSCALLIAAYVVSGLTQSMFAHALSASAYAIFVGMLLGAAVARVDPVTRVAPE
ncbi:O-antigen ligase family protein [Pseudoxanthomonas sp. PXM02]|uniref:O-antigen ligase family protein n=1 Tax=Pseudoxanthomonas sp. PXM02 TaxID=2769294 RepID=UPI00177B2CF3|nr:O-antigen ligase family protein [Pseudoxanthomonas sp. PXM02]MBD9480213.1 O-antigen ligase family protein [Pseudoxanthomonas sp. PXM02]